jgi:hypothetical protein
MDRLHARVEHRHARTPEDARACLLDLVKRIGMSYPGYNLRHRWLDEAKTGIEFEFEKEGRGRGGGTASLLEEGLVAIEVHAHFKLPFFVPVKAAEWKLKEGMTKALEESFGR